MAKRNEAFSRAIIDAQLKAQGRNIYDSLSVRFEYGGIVAELITCCVNVMAARWRSLKPNALPSVPVMRQTRPKGKDGYLDLSEVKTIPVRDKEIEKYRLLQGDLLITEGGDPDKLGRAAIWNGEIEVCLHQNHIFKVRPDPEQLLPEYLRELAGSRCGKAYFLRIAKKTTGIATINRTQLGNFPLLIPSLEIQREFV